jgi:hypothetical protein
VMYTVHKRIMGGEARNDEDYISRMSAVFLVRGRDSKKRVQKGVFGEGKNEVG